MLYKMASKEIVGLAFLVILVQAANGQQKCRTPPGPIGHCIPFELCEPLNKLVNKGSEVMDLIANSWCDGVQMICCPIIKSRQDVPRPSDGDQSATDYSTHPNTKLIDLHQCGRNSVDKIAYGEETQPYEFPWMAIIRILSENELTIHCGGSLISKRYVLTAAHCLKSQQGLIPIHSVVLGEHNTATKQDCVNANDCADPVQEIGVEEQIPHSRFSLSNAKNDIGLLRLNRDAHLSDSVAPVCLPYTIDAQSAPLRKIIVAGWGTTENNVPSTQLLKTTLNVVQENECSHIYKKTFGSRVQIDSKSLCAISGNSGSCKGDSGGPATFLASAGRLGPRAFQYGLVSAGTATCGINKGVPGLYIRITTYMQWILDNIRE